MPIIPLDDPDDPRLAPYRGVSRPELLAPLGAFIAEGRFVVRRLLLESSFATSSVLVTTSGLEPLADLLRARAPDVPVYKVPHAVMNAVSGFNLHRGCLAAGVRPPARPLASVLETIAGAARMLVLEQVSNPDNVGGIFRCAAALGSDAVVLGPGCGDPLYRKAIRTSIGTTLTVPFVFTGSWPDALGELRTAGLTTVALTPARDAADIATVAADVREGGLALVLGAEGAGLSAAALAAADLRVRIPLAAGVDSLNVTVAAGIALHALRHRRGPGLTAAPHAAPADGEA